MNRYSVLPLLAVLLVLALAPAPVLAQGKTATLYGYEKADYVSGMFSVNASGDSIALIGLKTVYEKPLDVYLTRSFDQSVAYKVGEVAPGKGGDMFFDVPALDIGGFDSALLMVPEWSVPVGVGLLE